LKLADRKLIQSGWHPCQPDFFYGLAASPSRPGIGGQRLASADFEELAAKSCHQKLPPNGAAGCD
jgi:hypothetical protein